MDPTGTRDPQRGTTERISTDGPSTVGPEPVVVAAERLKVLRRRLPGRGARIVEQDDMVEVAVRGAETRGRGPVGDGDLQVRSLVLAGDHRGLVEAQRRVQDTTCPRRRRVGTALVSGALVLVQARRGSPSPVFTACASSAGSRACNHAIASGAGTILTHRSLRASRWRTCAARCTTTISAARRSARSCGTERPSAAGRTSSRILAASGSGRCSVSASSAAALRALRRPLASTSATWGCASRHVARVTSETPARHVVPSRVAISSGTQSTEEPGARRASLATATACRAATLAETRSDAATASSIEHVFEPTVDNARRQRPPRTELPADLGHWRLTAAASGALSIGRPTPHHDRGCRGCHQQESPHTAGPATVHPGVSASGGSSTPPVIPSGRGSRDGRSLDR